MLILCMGISVLTICSCRKSITETVILPSTEQAAIEDSCTYVINGSRYTCNEFVSFGRGTGAASMDANGAWHPDSMQYRTTYQLLSTKATGNTSIIFHFIKNFGKNELVKTWPIGIKGPASETGLYTLGEHPFALDYNRTNKQSGIAIQASTTSGILVSYIYKTWPIPTSILPDSHKDSKFTITKFEDLPNGEHLLEASFSLKLFDSNETTKQLDSGYVRMHVY